MGDEHAEGIRSMTDLRFRWLLPEEFGRLEEDFVKENWAMPEPGAALIYAGEDAEGHIKAYVVLQSVMHIGPARIAEEYRHQGVWREPMEILKASFEHRTGGLMLVAMNPATEHIAEFLGMERSRGTLYLKDFGIGGE